MLLRILVWLAPFIIPVMGFSAICIGIFLLSIWAGFIAVGVCLIILAILIELSSNQNGRR